MATISPVSQPPMAPGVRTVPELPVPTVSRWRQLLIRILLALRPPRRTRPTRLGWAFLGLTLAIGFAALNTGNNLLYLVLSMMLSMLSSSGILSEFSVQRLQFTRRLPAEMVAGQDVAVTLTLHNPRRFTPVFGVYLEEDWPAGVSGEPCFFTYLSPGTQQNLVSRYRFATRGRICLYQAEVSTLFPFGLFRRSYYREVEDEVVVLPPIQSVRIRQAAGVKREGTLPLLRKGQGEEFYELRLYQQGDDPRRIHWPSSARRGRLLFQELADLKRSRVLIRLTLSSFLPVEQSYEEGIILVASYAAAYLKVGFEVAVEAPGVQLPFDSGEAHLRRVRRALALAPRADEAVEIPQSTRRSPDCGQVLITVGDQVRVEEQG